MADGLRKAHIHHKDGNPLNNDPRNWQVLCSKCHATTFSRAKKNPAGFYINIIFQHWLREEILQTAHHRCQLCGAAVGIIKHKQCDWCGHMTNAATRVEWQNEKIMCKECFDAWIKQGKPKEFVPRRHPN